MKFILMLWKKSLNCDSQQFLQYQQNEQSPLTITHWIQQKTTTYDVRNPVPGLGETQKCGRLWYDQTLSSNEYM